MASCAVRLSGAIEAPVLVLNEELRRVHCQKALPRRARAVRAASAHHREVGSRTGGAGLLIGQTLDPVPGSSIDAGVNGSARTSRPSTVATGIGFRRGLTLHTGDGQHNAYQKGKGSKVSHHF
jgi:hypothetical protein